MEGFKVVLTWYKAAAFDTLSTAHTVGAIITTETFQMSARLERSVSFLAATASILAFVVMICTGVVHNSFSNVRAVKVL